MKYSPGDLRVGDIVRVVGIPPSVKNHPEFKTLTLFRLCLGEAFPIKGFDRYNHLEIEMIRKRGSKFKPFRAHSIWIEPEFIRRVRRVKR